MGIKAKEKLFDTDENKKAWKHLMMYVFQNGKSLEQVAQELNTSEYFLMKFINKHMEISMMLVDKNYEVASSKIKLVYKN